MAAEQSRAVVQRLIDELWTRRDISRLDEFVDESLHEAVTHHFHELVDAFSDIQATIEPPGPIADGELVAARLLVTGTHDSAPFSGVDPSGKRLSWESIRIYRVVDGKVTETWAMQDRLGLMQQLGLVGDAGADIHWAAATDES